MPVCGVLLWGKEGPRHGIALLRVHTAQCLGLGLGPFHAFQESGFFRLLCMIQPEGGSGRDKQMLVVTAALQVFLLSGAHGRTAVGRKERTDPTRPDPTRGVGGGGAQSKSGSYSCSSTLGTPTQKSAYWFQWDVRLLCLNGWC